jgi:hypothetical protein
MARDSDSLFISEAARESWLLWVAVIGFFAVGGILASLISRFGLSERLVAEFALLAASLVLFLVVKVFVKIDSPWVVHMVTGSALLSTQLLLSLIIRESLAIGITVGLFGLVRELVKRFGSSESGSGDRNDGPRTSILLQNLLLGGLAFVISELVMRTWSAWRSS